MKVDVVFEDSVPQFSQTTCFLLSNYKALSTIAGVNMPAAATAFLGVA